jgi:hypothetical protein
VMISYSCFVTWISRMDLEEAALIDGRTDSHDALSALPACQLRVYKPTSAEQRCLGRFQEGNNPISRHNPISPDAMGRCANVNSSLLHIAQTKATRHPEDPPRSLEGNQPVPQGHLKCWFSLRFSGECEQQVHQTSGWNCFLVLFSVLPIPSRKRIDTGRREPLSLCDSYNVPTNQCACSFFIICLGVTV